MRDGRNRAAVDRRNIMKAKHMFKTMWILTDIHKPGRYIMETRKRPQRLRFKHLGYRCQSPLIIMLKESKPQSGWGYKKVRWSPVRKG